MLKPAPERLLTADDLPGPDGRYDRGELWDGVWVVCEPTKGLSGTVGSVLGARLWNHIVGKSLGWVTDSNQGFYVSRNPDRVLSPDVAFTSRGRLPRIPVDGFIPVAPDLAVEILSPSDRWDRAVAKAEVWLRHGSLVAWVLDPVARRAAVLRPGTPTETVDAAGTLDAAPALAGFRVALADLFVDLP